MYENFIKLTDALKNKGNKLIYLFNFPITLPDFYKPDHDQMDLLKAIVNSLKDEVPGPATPDGKKKKDVKWQDQEKKVKEVSNKLRSGIKHQPSSRNLNESVFDCNVKGLGDIKESHDDYQPS